jgi:hypothetical protein
VVFAPRLFWLAHRLALRFAADLPGSAGSVVGQWNVQAFLVGNFGRAAGRTLRHAALAPAVPPPQRRRHVSRALARLAFLVTRSKPL